MGQKHENTTLELHLLIYFIYLFICTVRVYLTLMFISPRGVISYDPISVKAMYVSLLM